MILDRARNARAAQDWRPQSARPIIFAGSVIVLGACLSLIALVYLSWASSQRLDPVERHLQHLRNLQSVNLQVQSALFAAMEGAEANNQPDQRTVERISIDLRNMLRADGYLHSATPDRILAAQNSLLRDDHSIRENLAATFDILQQALRDENQIQRAVIMQARQAARQELMIAMFSLIAVPIVLVAILLFFRRRLFDWSASLSEMLENVRESNLSAVNLPEPADPLLPVIQRYNSMVERLRAIEEKHSQKEQHLEHQIRVASDSLLRVQRDLAQAEQLSAIGEFSARVAHELRNPISGIAVALRNLRQEVSNPESVEVIDLVLEELDRINHLLNDLLARTPNERERFVPLSVADLCRDMITLFDYEGESSIDFKISVPDCICRLPRDSLRQAVLNVLRNSAEAMGESGGTIRFKGELADGEFVLTIEDSGPGFPRDLLRNGIHPFWTSKDGGSGLGLSILQRLIHNAGGSLRLENSESGGARTIMTLPCKA